MNGPLADYIGRKMCVITAVVVFVVGSAIQAGAVNIPMLFAGRFLKLHLLIRIILMS